MDLGRKDLERIREKLDLEEGLGWRDAGSKNCRRDVWVFARPLTMAVGFTKLISEGKTAVCHLALLVTTLKFAEVERILQEHRNGHLVTSHQEMGALWELYRDKDDKNHACVTRPFKSRILSKEWEMCCGTRAGRTTMTSQQIDREGLSPNNTGLT